MATPTPYIIRRSRGARTSTPPTPPIPPTPPPITVDVNILTGWTASNRYQSANSTGPNANTTGFSAWVMFTPNVNTTNQMLFGKSTSITGSQGWSFNGSTGAYRFSLGNGTNASNSPSIGFSDLEVGEICILHGVVRSGQIYLYKNGVQIFGSTSIASYTTTAFGVSIGSFSGGTPFQSGIIACGVDSSTGLDDTQVEAHYQALLLDPYAVSSGATNAWRSIDAGASWVDTIGGVSCTLNGTVTKTLQTLTYYSRYDYRATVSSTAPLSPLLPDVAGGLKVLPVGDSRTLGVGGTNQNSWRQGLYDSIIASGDFTNIDFVGPNGSTATDPQHDGNTGWTSGNHIVGIEGKPNISSVLSTYNPQIVIILLGVNSESSDSAMSQERTNYLDLIRTIYNFNNDMRIIVMEELENADPVGNGRAWAHNKWLLSIACPTLISEGVKLVHSKMYSSLKHLDSEFSDSVHPNDAGYAKMYPNIYPVFRLATGRT